MADYYTDNLIDEVLDLAKDSTLPRTRVLGYLQKVQDGVLGRHRYPFNEQRTITTLAADSTTYSYDADHQQIIQVVIYDDADEPIFPTYLSPDEFFDRFPLPDGRDAAAPEYYTDYAGELYWSCPLDLDYSLAFRFLAAPSRLEDSDASTPDIPEEYKDILIKGALSSVEQYRENHDIAAVYQREVEDLEADLLARYGLRKMQPGRARTVRRRIRAW